MNRTTAARRTHPAGAVRASFSSDVSLFGQRTGHIGATLASARSATFHAEVRHGL